MSYFKKKIIEFFKHFFRFLSYIIPKKKGLIVFQQWHNSKQFSGNIKSLILYANQNINSDKIKLLTASQNIKQEAIKNNINISIGFFNNFWNLIRAEFVVIDASVSQYYNWNLKFIQLWHGTGFKNIGLLNENNIKKEKFYHKLEKHYKNYELVVATSQDDKERKEDSFNLKKVQITGSPRNDLFFQDKDFNEAIKKKLQIQNYNKIISYTPTFRDFKTIKPFSDKFWFNLNMELKVTNTLFIVKKHPWDQHLNVPKNLKYIKDMTAEISDVQELLIISDILISDYSGIITDFSITKRPILLYMYDFEKYTKTNRSFYYDLEEILPKPFVYNEEDLMDKIKNLSWIDDAEYQKSYKKFRNRFHKYLDGNSSHRVLEAIKKLSS